MRKVHIACEQYGGHAYAKMFKERGWEVSPLDEADLVQFTGGADVSPEIYGEAMHPTTHSSRERDYTEARVFKLCQKMGIPMAGICRGGQFLNVMCGGKMYQNIDNHCRTHLAVDLLHDRMIQVTSTHHQMMRPGEGAELLMVASEASFAEHMSQDSTIRRTLERGEDVEAVFYRKQRVLCFQPHPEMGTATDECRDTYFNFIEEKILCAD